MKKKIFITIFCIILVTSITAGVLYLFLRKKPANKINEQTQVVEYIKSLNDSLLKNESVLDYGCTYFDNRDAELKTGELDVSQITFKKPVFGYVYVEDVFVQKPVLTSFDQSLIYAETSVKQITNYVFYFDDSEVSGVRYATNYNYRETLDGTSAFVIDYEIKYDEKFEKNANYLNNVVNVKDFYDETLKEENKDYDWTASIKKACEEINKTGGILFFPNDTYLVSVTSEEPNVLTLTSQKEIVVDFCNSKLKMSSNNLGQYRMVLVKQCDRVTVKNGVLQGDRMLHDYSDPGTGQFRETHEGGHGVNVRSARVADIYNMEIYDFTGDGVCFSNTYGMEKNDEGKYVYVGNPTIVNIDKSVIHHCRRQGVSVIDCKGFRITDSEIYSIGQFSWAYETDCDNEDLKDLVVKGTAPSAGIDFEPDRYTFLVEKAVVENCYIHNTDNFAMVNTTVPDEIKEQGYLTTTPNLVITNTLASSSPNLSGENIDENGIFRQAVVKYSTFVFDKLLSYSGYDDGGNLKYNGAIGMSRVKFINSRIIKTYQGGMSLWTEDCEFYNCLFEQNERTLNTAIGDNNGHVSFVRAKLVNNTFNNMIGTGQNTSYYYTHGVLFMTNAENGGGVVKGSHGNVFYNSSVFLRQCVTIENETAQDTATFNNCKLFAYPNNTDLILLKNITLKDCETKANGGAQVVLENCKLINSGAFGYYNRKFVNCYIELEEISEMINYTDGNGNSYGVTNFGGHSLGDSKSSYLYGTTIVVKGDISHSSYDIRAFRNTYFYDSCKIILNKKYSSKKVVFKDQDDRSVKVEYI